MIGKDSVVCYTHIENRRIATLLMEGEYYKSVAQVSDSIIAHKDLIIDTYKVDNEINHTLITTQNKRLQELLLIADKNVNRINRLDKSKRFWRTTAFITTGICTILLVSYK